MARLTILFVFLFILFIQFEFNQTVSIYRSSLDNLEEPLLPSPISSQLLNYWYNHLQENQQENNEYEHIWKRFLPDATHIRQIRRFGNTRYGRSLSNDNK